MRKGFFFARPYSDQIKMQFERSRRRIEKHYLSSSVYDMAIIFSSFINDALQIGGFDSRIIRINKMVLEK